MMKELFRDGNWRLVLSLHSWHDQDKSAIQHRCYKNAPNNWWYYTYEEVCHACWDPRPEALIGLQLLHNWDR